MTETVSGASGGATGRARKAPAGLRIGRVYTTPGIHPYDEVAWERRDVVMTNWRDGSINFEQRGVEFPDFWSVNAANIVTTKYFRGAVGTPQREWSLKQLVDRVVRRYRQAGEENGYFASPEDAEVFEHELTWMLVHQVFSFNSPVWFNVGTASPQQVSACQPYDALVSTPEGLVPIGELVERGAVGSKVYDADGLTRVVAVKSNGVKQVLRLHLKSGQALDVTPDHLVWKSTGAGSGRFVEAATLRPGDRLEWYRRTSFGEAEIRPEAIAEAALAGWLQADGFVGQYATGPNRSLTIEAMTVTPAELAWVTRALDTVFPQVHRKETAVATRTAGLDCRRTRLYGEALRPFVERWDLLVRGRDMRVPAALMTAPLPVAAAYLRSLFQAEGYVSARQSSTLVGLDMVAEELVRGVQALLARFGIFARVGFKRDDRPGRQGGIWSLRIQNAGDRRIFADEVGFVDPAKADKLERSFDLPGRPAGEVKLLEIARIEPRGSMPVYDIQTESGEYLSAGLRVHNCFILAVDDTMDSILNWYKEEGLIFKGGSGAGLNLSRIRSSKELLSSGGTASGPVSFMRGADASAGTIKSGGATRRAAKMVVLDVDHPDIEEFIETKAREEEKIRVLRDAGYDMDLGGKDITSVQYQNANNSVRVSDEFMRAVESRGTFGLRARTTGEVMETVDAHELFRKMSKAAWECADPGIQYDDTINDWHTCPETGRITASNPCSEFMHLDNSSCNLASLNLMKFLHDNGTFDAQTFAKAVELVITAMDISICFGDFPTESITVTTRAYRQLGIGYANLGALLMATGHPYDSDSGRALAAAITSLMTGTAYRRSAELAGIVGPYDGFARNAEAHKRVMRKHQAANDVIRASGDAATVLAHATRAWADCISTGDRNGFRNSQASVLAPTGTIGLMMDCDTTGVEPDLALVKNKKLVGGASMRIVNNTVPRALRALGYAEETVEAIVEHIAEHGNVIDAPGLRPDHYAVFDCAMGERSISAMGHVRMMAAVQPFISGAISKCVTGESLVATRDGLVRIGSWHDGEAADTFRDHIVELASLGGTRKTDAFYYGGVRPVREVVLRSGHRIVGTYPHRLLVAGEGGLVWRTLADIQPGEYVAMQYGTDVWSEIPPSLRGVAVSQRHGSQKRVSLPEEMTEELAFLLGAYAAEGHTTRSNWTVTITNSVESVLQRVKAAWLSEFGLPARVTREPGRCPGVVVSAKAVVQFLDELGCGERASTKRIPDAILTSPRPMVLAFLQGLALDAYVTHGEAGKWAICLDSPRLLDDLQAVLTNLGVVHSRVSKRNAVNGKTYDEVYACGEHAARLLADVRFLEPDKQARAQEFLARGRRQSTADVVPGISGADLYALIPAGTSGRRGRGTGRQAFNFLRDERTRHVSRRTVERVATLPGVQLPGWLRTVLDDNLHFSPVVCVDDAGEREVFDVSVPVTHAFVANGVVNHNTVNMVESSTIEDVERIYFEGWKLGLKALAIYRDNCKVGQPLSDAKAKKAEAAPEVPAPVVEQRPVRKRLPKTRPSRTTSFTVAGAEGYMTAGSYPNDGLGEVFLKLGKQGSTLAGVMDAFSIAVSIGLQYGVPLEAFVSKFVNMRFDPAGMTDDPDVRMAQSIMDYIFRRLALDYMDYETREQFGIFTADERVAQVESAYGGGGAAPAVEDDVDVVVLRTSAPTTRTEPAASSAQAPSGATGHGGSLTPSGAQTSQDAPLCFNCGVKMRPAGSCYVCESCGSTSGCS